MGLALDLTVKRLTTVTTTYKPEQDFYFAEAFCYRYTLFLSNKQINWYQLLVFQIANACRFYGIQIEDTKTRLQEIVGSAMENQPRGGSYSMIQRRESRSSCVGFPGSCAPKFQRVKLPICPPREASTLETDSIY
ncbi:hypothetical protein PHMEG_00022070 [Phytophthora megakarya]|uniref:Uncharacterized protein n=1 Tax=Phytophthora megakarya TaxID=4795 RepID=A0A225VJM5_9STRA|nr:hypothetical protein PHMEG_00022070 [Phytophthora megakarya]